MSKIVEADAGIAYMCVTPLYCLSTGDVVRKSALTGVTFLHFARFSIVFRVPKRFLSRSNAYSCHPGLSILAGCER